jgi:hypothetical protein
MKFLWLILAGLLVAAGVFLAGILWYEDGVLLPDQEPAGMSALPADQQMATVNTTRIGTDDAVETAVAVSQIIYPATEEENVPGAVVLINRNNLGEAMVAASRVQHFPVNAPLLLVDEQRIPELTRQELLRLKPEGVPMDQNTQVYLIGAIGDAVRQEIEQMGYQTRSLRAPNPIELAEVVDEWTSVQHGDYRNIIAIANLDNLDPALPSAFFNAHMGEGLAYVTDDGIPDATLRMITRRANGPWLYLFGDETVISAEIARGLAQYGHVTRIPRSDPAAASAYFAGFKDQGQNWGAWYVQDARDFGWGISEAGHNAIFVNLNGPAGWQNALVATTLSHMGKHAPVLLVDQDGVPEPVVNYLEILKPYPTAPQQQLLNHGWIIGGEGTVSRTTQARIDLLLEGQLDASSPVTRQ